MSIEKFKKTENIKLNNSNKLSSLIEIFSECQELKELYMGLSSFERIEEYFYTPERGVEMKWTPLSESRVFFENMGIKDVEREQFIYEKKSVSGYFIPAKNIKVLVKIRFAEEREEEKVEKNIKCLIKIIKEFFIEDIIKEKKSEDEKNRRNHLATIVANEYRYFSLLESLREAVIVAEKRGEMYIIVDINEACVLYLMKTREEIIGKDMFFF